MALAHLVDDVTPLAVDAASEPNRNGGDRMMRRHRPQALSLHGSIMISFPLGPGRNEFGPAVVRVRTAKSAVAGDHLLHARSPPARTFRRLAECNCNERNRPY